MSILRVQRVSELIKETIGDILTKIKDPRIGFVTITDVKVSPDLENARIFVSILGDEKQRSDSLKGLESASGYIRHELGKEIRLKKIPKLFFQFDPGIERGVRIVKLIDEISSSSTGEQSEGENENK